ncbi:hypothetical protein [Streptomyces sp. NPDC049906]|uniref:hypothetical protein n=1 Tax=Streptomyces sp. NPDC049906 TaxID=3155656 RepID=UPI0034243351
MRRWDWQAEQQQWDPSPVREDRRARAQALERTLRVAALVLAVVVLVTLAVGGVLLHARHR